MGSKDEPKRCPLCGKLYEIGTKSICRTCQLRRGKPKPPRRAFHRKLRCDCGKPAVTVITVRVGDNGVYQARLPLCADCLKLEQSYGLVSPATNSGDLPSA